METPNLSIILIPMIILRTTPPLEEQREFGVINSKLIRPFRAKVGRMRKSAAKKLIESSDKNLERIDIINSTPDLKAGVQLNGNKAIAELQSAIGRGTINNVYRNQPFTGFNFVTKDINVQSGESPLGLFHELGHAKIKAGERGRINKKIHEYIEKEGNRLTKGKDEERRIIGIISGQKGDIRSNYAAASSNGNVGREVKTAGGALKDLYKTGKAHLSVLANERVASKSAIKDVRPMIEGGSSKRVDSIMKKNTRNWEQTYRESAKSHLKQRMANLINIPSRRVGGEII